MDLHWIDITIIVGYIIVILVMGWLLTKRASRDLDSYFLGGKTLPWWVLGTSHGASGFDITGTMWFVTMLYTYGTKAAWIPWVWPLFDRIFRQVYLGPWIRRSNVLTGAEWMKTRFGTATGGTLSHISVVIYALVLSIGFLAYAFQGIGKFAEVFFPWDLAWGPFGSAEMYGVVILLLTTAYVLFGGWYSVVLTDLIQFVLLTVASIFIAVVAMQEVRPDMLNEFIPDGWRNLFFGFGKIDLDWSELIPTLNRKIVEDGYSLFGIVVMIFLLRGLLVSLAGPTPGYGMQHVLSTRNPREAALENWWMSIVQLVPRFLMITGIAVLGLTFFTPEVRAMVESGEKFDFEQILPYVMSRFVPIGLVGIMMAGLLAAFMSTFDSTLNAGAAYIVNDVYKRYINPNLPAKVYVRAGYGVCIVLVVLAIVVGMGIQSIHDITTWITAALYAGYVAPNILKWHWWRFNGHGYFAGMMAGVIAAIAFRIGMPDANALYWFPVLLAISTVAAVVVCLLTPPESKEVLHTFYRDVRSWGFWGPVYEEMVAKEPSLVRNHYFARDAFNVANGIIWQLTLMVIPICLVIREIPTLIGAVVVLAVTSYIMKIAWYDKLGKDTGDSYWKDDAKEANDTL